MYTDNNERKDKVTVMKIMEDRAIKKAYAGGLMFKIEDAREITKGLTYHHSASAPYKYRDYVPVGAIALYPYEGTFGKGLIEVEHQYSMCRMTQFGDIVMSYLIEE